MRMITPIRWFSNPKGFTSP
ncbi:hypothetical protein IEO21_10808 [Rhodonia placenta]|uniref:Uncharacterized protein n=1 Tax=Rhodonia placenta TaxID=104341 RepID=A0A8H7TWZ1_9APHY|nr:hypothetical protein IEO21_10808 [Postia placenta]